jgi:hypothetical protein
LAAFEALTSMGAGGFAERARRELQATGARVRKRTEDTRAELTRKRRRSPNWPGQ